MKHIIKLLNKFKRWLIHKLGGVCKDDIPSIIDEKELKFYDEWNKERYNNRKDKDNIFPVGISDDEFIEIIKDLFLGSDWYCVNPISHTQINEEILEEILFKITKKNPNERCK